MAADEPAAECTSTTFASLPHALTCNVFSRLPVDARARAAAVCLPWRDTLADASLWRRLDLSASCGVTCTVTEAALRGAARLARGGLQALDVSGFHAFSQEALLEVTTANAGALRELRVCLLSGNTLHYESTETLLRSAPRLQSFDADVVTCSVQEAHALLSGPDFAALRVRELCAAFDDAVPPTVVEQTTSLQALAAGIAAHTALVVVTLHATPHSTPAALDAVMDAALSRGLAMLNFEHCHLTPASAPALARLLGSCALTTLRICNAGRRTLLDLPAAALVCGALRANRTLNQIWLQTVGLWNDPAVGLALLAALTAHPSIVLVVLQDERVRPEDAAAAGAAFAALLAANSPALRELDLDGCVLGEDTLRLLLGALRGNTHLTLLHFDIAGVAADRVRAFARSTLRPAVLQAHAALRLRVCDGHGHQLDVEALAR
jgi:hypothetical protein